MAEYFETKKDAEQFIKEWYAKDRKPPVFFAKIINHGVEKWIVNYDPRQSPMASPYIKVLENFSHEIQRIVTAETQDKGDAAPSDRDATPKVYSEGESVRCGSCGKALTVKYYEAGKQVFATREALQTQALKCQDCGFITCASCAMPPGGGGAVCPSCKSAGGPYFFTRTGEMSDEEQKRLKEEEARWQEGELESEKRRQEERRVWKMQREAEAERRKQIQRQRESQRQCIMCGQPLGFMDKLSKRLKHKHCFSYLD